MFYKFSSLYFSKFPFIHFLEVLVLFFTGKIQLFFRVLIYINSQKSMQIFLFYSIPMLSFMNETHFKVLFEFSTIQFALLYQLYACDLMTMCALSNFLSTKGLLQCFVKQDKQKMFYINGWAPGGRDNGEDLPSFVTFFCIEMFRIICHLLKFQYIYTYLCQCLVLPVTKEKDACVWQNNLLWLYFLQQSHGANTKYSRDWRSILSS